MPSVAQNPGATSVNFQPLKKTDKAETFRLLRTLADQDGLSVLLITHDKAVATAMADSVMALQRMVAIAAER